VDGKEQEQANKEKALSNAKKEILMIKEQRIKVQKSLDILKKEFEIKCKNHEVALKNYKILRPTWAFEEDPEYLANMRELSLIGFEKFKEEQEMKIKQHTDTFVALDNQEVSQLEYIESLEKELKEMIGDGK
jgi:hypothetical protein